MTRKIRGHFEIADPVLHSYIEKIKIREYVLPTNLFATLCESIINQQLSSKAADTIFARFTKLFSGKITAAKLLKISDVKLRACGISYGKARYLKDLGVKVNSGELILEELKNLPDGLVIEKLTTIKGIGRWTAEMFLMFALGRQDVFSSGDLGLRRAIQKIYGFKKEPTIKQMEKIVSKWKPYRTYASRILWRSRTLS